MKKVILCFMLLALVGILAACNRNGDTPAEATPTPPPAETPAPTPEPTAEPDADADETANDVEEAAGLRIAIVTSSSGIDDGSFNQNNFEGIQTFLATSPDSYYRFTRDYTGAPANAISAVEQIVAEVDVVVMPGFQFGGIGQVALDNPDTYFILIDAHPAEVNGITEFPNVRAMLFAEQESGFLAGIAAAMETQTGLVAFVGGTAIPPVVNYQFGFESGVNFANTHLGTSAELVNLAPFAGTDVTGANVGGNYVGGFADVPTGLVIGEALLAEGADIIFVAAGMSGNGVFTAVMQDDSGAMVIGVDVDQYLQGYSGDRNIVLTSALKVMDLNVFRALVSIAEGNFVSGNYVMTAETNSTGVVTTHGRHQMSDATVDAINDLFSQVMTGTIVPAANFNGHQPDNFPGL